MAKVTDSKFFKHELLTGSGVDEADGQMEQLTEQTDEQSWPGQSRKDVCTFIRVLLTAKTEQQ